MDDLVNLVARNGIEELLLEPGRPPIAVSQGQRRFLDAPLVNTSNANELFRFLSNEEQKRELNQCGQAHFTCDGPNYSRLFVSAVQHGEGLTLELKPLRLAPPD